MEQLKYIFVPPETKLRDALRVMSQAPRYGLPPGIVLVGSPTEPLHGVVTDGDVRRGLIRGVDLNDAVSEVMTADPIVFSHRMEYPELIRAIPQELAATGRYRDRSLEKLILVDDQGKVTQVLDFVDFWRQQQAVAKPVAVIGLGHVGLTLAVVMAEVGYHIVGVERDEHVLGLLRAGLPPFDESGLPPLLGQVIATGRMELVGELPDPEGSPVVYVVAVGTPLRGDGTAQLTELEAALSAVASRLERGALVILRSTVPVGTCRDVAVPTLQKSGLKVDQDFLLAFAPERTVEGNALEELRTLPQVIGGHNDVAAEQAAAIFRELTPAVVIMDSLEEAEMIKLINNSFRDLSFAFANELALVCQAYNLDAARIIRAANEGYPRNPIPLPSPGVGGPCLTKDPYFYAAVAERAGLTETLAVQGRKVNERIPVEIAERVVSILKDAGVAVRTARVLVVGLAFKGWPETSDVRDSSAIITIETLRALGVRELHGIDPVVSAEELSKLGLTVFPTDQWEEGFRDCHAVLFMNNHPSYRKWDIYKALRLMNQPAILFDGWQTFDSKELASLEGLHVLGMGFHRGNTRR